MKKHSLILAAIISACIAQGAYCADISKVTVTFPVNPQTEKAVNWFSSGELTESDFKVSQEPAFTDGKIFSGESGPAVQTNELWHKASAGGLSPDTRYYFRVGDAQKGVWSKTGSFKTAPPRDKAFTFIALTDTQSSNKNEANISAETMAAALKTAPEAEFIVHSGDVTDRGTNEAYWDSLLGSAESTLINTTIAPAAGNHESASYSFNEHFNLPVPQGSDIRTGAYYSFDYGPAHFTTLNTNESSELYSNLSAEQAEWMKTDISRARKNGAKWIIINAHKGFYTTGPYSAAPDIIGPKGNRTLIAPMLEELGADLVLQGHDHTISATKPLAAGIPADGGTVYLNTGVAGVKVYNRNPNLSPDYIKKFDYLPERRNSRGRIQSFAVIRVTSDAMSADIYEIDRHSGSNEPYKVYSMSMTKSGG